MAVLSVSVPTILDEAKQTLRGSGGEATRRIVELLAQQNPVMQTAYMKASSKPGAHVWTARTRLPTVTRRRFNEGIRPSKSGTDQIEMKLGNVFGMFEQDYHLARQSGDVNGYVASEIRALTEAVSQDISKTVFYGNEKSDESSWTGLVEYYNSTTKENGGQVLKAGTGSTDNRSIWAVCWGEGKIGMVYDKNQPMGIEMVNPRTTSRGTYWVDNARVAGSTTANGRMEVLGRQLSFYGGVAVEDWRYAARLCNISIAALKHDAASGPNLIDGLRALINRVRQSGDGQLVLYTSRGILEVLSAQAVHFLKSANLSMEQIYNTGVSGVMIDGIPLLREDALDTNDDSVS